jgi:hypothetical protein
MKKKEENTGTSPVRAYAEK